MEKPIVEPSNPERTAVFLLIITNVLWGTTFTITKFLMVDIDVFLLTAIRHFFSILLFIPFYKHFLPFNKRVFKIGAFAGLLYMFGVVFQSFGLQTTTASKGGFLTAMNCIFVPLFSAFIFKTKVQKNHWIATFVAFSGIAVLSFSGFSFESFQFNLGDGLVLISAVFFAFYIIYLGKRANSVDTISFTAYQLTAISFYCFVIALIVEDIPGAFANSDIVFSPRNIWLLLYLGVIATSLPFFFQAFGQKHLPASRAAVIFTLEPIFSSLFGILWNNEIFTTALLIGGLLVVLGLIIAREKKIL
jgi:drug/metabolite transporter (DMT)-like permease